VHVVQCFTKKKRLQWFHKKQTDVGLATAGELAVFVSGIF
jgi:hypothetical protein